MRNLCFGIWEIDSHHGIIAQGYDFTIPKEKLWATYNFRGHTVWLWLINITHARWVQPHFDDFAIAFLYAQEFFAEKKPCGSDSASTVQSIYIAKQLLPINSRPSSSYSEEMEKIKFLDLGNREQVFPWI